MLFLDGEIIGGKGSDTIKSLGKRVSDFRSESTFLKG